jgi:hypothetical protein
MQRRQREEDDRVVGRASASAFELGELVVGGARRRCRRRRRKHDRQDGDAEPALPSSHSD